MIVRRVLKFFLGVQAIIFLVPTTVLFGAGFNYWFGIFIPTILAEVHQGAKSKGLEQIDLPGIFGNDFIFGLTVYLILAASGLFSAWWLLVSCFIDKTIASIRWFVWCGLILGCIAAYPFVSSSTWWNPESVSVFINDFAFRALMGLGPIISSIASVGYLFFSKETQFQKKTWP